MNSEIKAVFLMLIAARKLKDALLTEIADGGAKVINTVYGKGSVKAGFLTDLLGLAPEEHKVVIMCLIKADKADALLLALEEKFHFDTPNTGIAFTVPVEALSY